MNATNSITHTYLLKNLTNLHVGRGDTNYGILDNEVQRDPITELPMIHSSSLKGAFRECLAFMEGKGDMNVGRKHEDVQLIFGSDKNDREHYRAATHRFFSAHLLALPVRSNIEAYLMATAPGILRQFLDDLELHDTVLFEKYQSGLEDVLKKYKPEEKKPIVFCKEKKESNNYFIDEFENPEFEETNSTLETLLGHSVVLMHDNALKDVAKRLPAIARNKLENGKSENLWYEEVVPRQSRFYFFVSENRLPSFRQKIESNAFRVQIGANASIGYGFCQLQPLNSTTHAKTN